MRWARCEEDTPRPVRTVYFAKKAGCSVHTMNADWAVLRVRSVTLCSLASKKRSVPNCFRHISIDRNVRMLALSSEHSSVYAGIVAPWVCGRATGV